MINENELRVGNWVHHSSEWSSINEKLKSFDFQWDSGHWHLVAECRMRLEAIYPITISEEWLIKLGLQGDGRIYCTNAMYFEQTHGCVNVYIDRNDSGTGVSSMLIYEGIIYVHELQNLFFSLTGQELTIKH